MAGSLGTGATLDVAVENIGGIDRATVQLAPGVNVLEGRNATNRTSLLQAVMAGFGSERTTLKGDADEGRVDVAMGDTEVTRRLVRRNGEVVFDGDAVLADPELADLFAFLLESNEARRAGKRGEALRDLIMRPVDTAEIRERIRSLEREKRSVDEDLDALEALESERAELETERAELERTIEARESELATLREDLESAEADPSSGEAAVEELREARAELDELEFDLETERETLAELAAERERVTDELDALEAEAGDSPDRLAGRLDELRDRKRALDATVADLQSVITFNEERLDDGGLGLGSTGEGESPDVTDQLLDDAITCWTCGSTVEAGAVEETLERLRALHASKLDERRELEARIEDLAERQAERQAQAERREHLEARREELDREMAATEATIEDLTDERETLSDTVDALEAEVDASPGMESVLATQRELTQVELELERHRDRLESVESRIGELEARLEEREDLESRRAAIDEELRTLRGRVERIEAEAVDSFNEHMDAILGVLEYDNVERIWIERRESSGRDAGGQGSTTAFDLHVVRSTADGTTYEDVVAHLSESEREVTGLVFALAGFLAHDVYETVPVMLLDSLEAIDAERIADLVAYFEDYVDCLVVALLPEDAAALPDDYTYHREF